MPRIFTYSNAHRLLVLAVVIGGLVAGIAAAAIGQGDHHPPGETDDRSIDDALEQDIAAMIDGGMPEDDPKIQMLQDDLAALRSDAGGMPEPLEEKYPVGHRDAERIIATMKEHGIPEDDPRIQAVRDEIAELRRRGADMSERAAEPAYDSGEVDCEVLPGGLLTVEDIDGATCLSVPQPDGWLYYVAISPAGRVRAVEFAGTGSPRRIDDRDVDLPDAASFRVTPAGDVVARGQGRPPVVIDFE